MATSGGCEGGPMGTTHGDLRRLRGWTHGSGHYTWQPPEVRPRVVSRAVTSGVLHVDTGRETSFPFSVVGDSL